MAVAAAADLPPEVLLCVFHKLPVKEDVLRCKAVCREWRRLISDPFFKYKPSGRVSLMMIPHDHTKLPFFSFDIDRLDNPRRIRSKILRMPHAVRVLGSCNGLVALYNKHGDFCLLNPATGEEKLAHVSCPELAEDLWGYTDLHGLGLDHVTNEYKAVLHSYPADEFYVVSFKDADLMTEELFQAVLPHEGLFQAREGPTVVRDGVPHWLCHTELGYKIVYLDLSTEEIGMIGLPKELHLPGKRLPLLGDLDGQLTVGIDTGKGGTEVWGLEGDDSWSKLFVMGDAPTVTNPRILGWMGLEELLVNVSVDPCLKIYNLKNKTWTRQPFSLRRRSMFTQLAYTPSFASPK